MPTSQLWKNAKLYEIKAGEINLFAKTTEFLAHDTELTLRNFLFYEI